MLSVISHRFIPWSFGFRLPKGFAKPGPAQSPLLAHSWLGLPALRGPRRLPALLLNLLPNATALPPPLQPSGATTEGKWQTSPHRCRLLWFTLHAASRGSSKGIKQILSCPAWHPPGLPTAVTVQPKLRRPGGPPDLPRPPLPPSSLSFLLFAVERPLLCLLLKHSDSYPAQVFARMPLLLASALRARARGRGTRGRHLLHRSELHPRGLIFFSAE